jgi:uncharacterized RDD family membrane protein YckC
MKINMNRIAHTKIASLLTRVWGGSIDILILCAAIVPIGTMLKFWFPFNDALIYCLGLLFVWIYQVYYISSKNQSTLGSKFAGIHFATTNGMPITFIRALIVSGVKLVLYFPVMIYLSKIIFGQQLPTQTTTELFVQLAILVSIHAAPYFFTEKKQLFTDIVLGIIVIKN